MKSPRIVCAVDYSQGASHALGHAAALARDLRATVEMVHVAPDGPYAYGSRSTVERSRHAAWEGAQHLFASLRKEHGLDATVAGEVLHGPAAGALIKLSADPDVVLMVVGSRGRGSFKSALLGSVSSALAEAASCPVMIVPAVSCDAASRTGGVVCGIADSDLGSAEVAFATYLSDELGAPLRFVHVDTTISLVPPARAIDEVARKESARVVVVGARGRGRFGTLLLGSLSAHLATTGGRPVVVVPAADAATDEGPQDTAASLA